jgi:uncharacterized protein YkwD
MSGAFRSSDRQDVSNDTSVPHLPGFAILDLLWPKGDSVCLLHQQNECVARGAMTMKLKIVAIFSMGTIFATGLGIVAGSAARADDVATAIYSGVSQLRQACGMLGDDPRLTLAAQRHADDMARNGVGGGHIGSDGSSPRVRIADAGYTRPGYTGEIIYWGTGTLANPRAALDWWMASPPHQATILNCAFTAVGFATAWDGNKMIAVGDFAGP